MKITIDFFPVIKTRLVGVTENDMRPFVNFDERYGKSFYEALENFKDSVSIG